MVEVYASVSDARGEPVTDLTADDFRIEENGVAQTPVVFTAGELPLALAVGLDRSFSVSASQLAASCRAVGDLLSELRPDDQSMVLAIGSETEVIAPLSTNRGTALSVLGRLEPWGTTPLYDAARAAIDRIQQASGRRALILLSDGQDRYSGTSETELLAFARSRDVLVYPIATGERRPPVFAELAAVTGGRSFRAAAPERLAGVLATIARELRHQYLIGYVSTVSGSVQPGWRSIRVTVQRPGVVVRARDGYVAG
jgi:VWFA-related protein